jgi:hypothetical protein
MSAPTATTLQRAFYTTGPTTGPLFDVRAGVPALVSLEQASCFLGAVYQTLQDTAEEPNADVIYGAAYLTEMAKAVIDSVAAGIARHEGTAV